MPIRVPIRLLLGGLVGLLAALPAPEAAAWSKGVDKLSPYPPTRVEIVRDSLHGVAIEDPYRWLENGDSEEVREWVAAQNAYTTEILGKVPGREAIRERLETLMAAGRLGVTRPRGDRYFFTRRKGEQNHAVLYLRRGLEAEPEVCIDINPLSEDGTLAMDWWEPSPDGRHVAYGLSEHGSENSTLYLRDVDSGKDLPLRIPRARHAEVAWDPDGRGFYYCRYPGPDEVPAGEESYHRSLYHHVLGTDWREDPLIWHDEVKEAWPYARVSPDGRWLLVHVWLGHSKNWIYLRDLAEEDGEWRTVVKDVECSTEAYAAGGMIYLHSNHGAPNFRVLEADPAQPGIKHWRELISETRDALTDLRCVGGRLFARYLHDAHSVVRVFDPDGTYTGELDLPGLGSGGLPAGQWDGNEAFYGFESYFQPRSVYRYDIRRGESRLVDRVEIDVDVDPYVVKQVWFESTDGTPVSMFLVHRRGILLDGSHPALLTGYGGFSGNMTPHFSSVRFMLLERGFVFAVPNLRGGGEYGEAWHEAGMLGKKQNTFDDFLAAAEYLIEQDYTRPERLAIKGGSNGGLLVGAALVQRPELFRAVLCDVPLLDMLRYHRFLIARLWIPEYGCADDPAAFEWLRAYSPYHHVHSDTPYPAVLLSAAESDGRVDPLHARKMTAALQAATSSDLPVLLRQESKAGHGRGKPLRKVVDEIVDEWSFLFWQLEVEQL